MSGCDSNSPTGGPKASDYVIKPVDYFAKIPLARLFPKVQPVEVDLGCGEGLFLVELARLHPERNFLGVERQFSRVRKVSERARRAGLKNLRVLRVESDFFVRQMLEPNSVSRLYVLFADPWPKKRHHERRLVQPRFLTHCAQVLSKDGDLCIKTDHREYFEHIAETLATCSKFKIQPWEEDLPVTDFERRFLRIGLPINKIRGVVAH